MKKTNYLLILLAISMFLFLFGLGDMALTDPDETFYAQTAKEMFNAEDWITPSIFGKPQFEKPIFYYWLIMISYLIFGVGEFAARFPSAIFGLLGVLGTYFLGRRLFSPLCGFLSGLVAATCVQYIILSRACVTDMVFTVTILFCLIFFIEAWMTNKRISYVMASIMAGLAVLTKGPIGLFIPGMIIIIYIAAIRGWKKIRNIPIILSLLAFLAIAAPWYLIVGKIHGSLFVDEFFVFHNVTRFLEPEHKIGSSPFFYIPIILGGFFPWSFFLPASTIDMYKKRKVNLPFKKTGTFLALWFLVIVIFFSISRTKIITYNFPLFTVMAVVVGRFWEQFINSSDGKINKRIRRSYFLFAGTCFLVFIGMSLFVRYKYPGAFPGTILAGTGFISGIILSLIFFLKDKRTRAFFAIILAVILISFPVFEYILPWIEESESSKTISYRLKEIAKPREAIGGESDIRRGVAFYADRVKIEDVHSYDDLNNFISRRDRVWAVLKKKHYDQIKKARPEDVSMPIFTVGKKVLATNITRGMRQGTRDKDLEKEGM